jgi:hypothetical protein
MFRAGKARDKREERDRRDMKAEGRGSEFRTLQPSAC